MEKVEDSTQYSIDKTKRLSLYCTYQQKIEFDPSRKSKSGELIQINEDRSLHQCGSQQRYRMSSADNKISNDTARLLCEVIEKLLQSQKELNPKLHAATKPYGDMQQLLTGGTAKACS